ncbi:MAG: 50S ribosomal protein L13 [Candidatus Undinarchaeales archaeon]
MKVIDATDLKAGRIASRIAKKALEGEEFIIINSEKAVISGSKETNFEKYSKKRDVGSRYRGPFFPKRSDRILRRTIRGMLPYKKKRGKEALKRIKTYIGVPEEFKDKKAETIEKAKIGNVEKKRYIQLEKLSKKLGGKK